MAETNGMDMFNMFKKAQDMAEILKAGQAGTDSAWDQRQGQAQAQDQDYSRTKAKGPTPENSPDGPRQTFSMEDFIKAAEMMQLMQNTMRPNIPPWNGPPTAHKQAYAPFPPPDQYTAEYFDNVVNTPALRSMKAALPYLEWEHRRILGICIKLIELQRLMGAYHSVVVSLQAQSPNPGDWQRGMLMAIQPHLPESRQKMIDMALKCMDMKMIMDVWQKPGPNPPFNGF